MKKIFFTLVLLFSTLAMFAKEGGTLTASTTPIDPTQTVTFSYDGKNTNFTNWTPKCFVHVWLLDANNNQLYSTTWNDMNGDDDYNKLDNKVKMKHDGREKSGQYTIDINLQSFFNIPEEKLSKIIKVGIVVRAPYTGESNQTIDFFFTVKYEGGSVTEPTPEPEYEDVTLYFVNDGGWETVNAHIWYREGSTDISYGEWPGNPTAKTDKQVNGKNVYSYTFSNKYTNIIFNCGEDCAQTQNDVATYDAAKPYFSLDNYKWYATLEEIENAEVNYYIKHPWGGGAWTWEEMQKQEDGLYTYDEGLWGGGGANIDTQKNDNGNNYIPENNITGASSITVGSRVRFIYNATDKTLSVIVLEAAPKDDAKFYISGNGALVGEDREWNSDAIKVKEDSYTFKNLATGIDYQMKITLDGKWETGTAKGYGDLTDKDIPGLGEKDGNIQFQMAEPGDVTVTYIEGVEFTVKGNFYVEPVEPVVTTTLTFIPTAIWDQDGAKFAAWAWGDNDNPKGEWVSFFGQTGDKLTADINVKATKIKFVRFNSEIEEPYWPTEGDDRSQIIWNETGDLEINTQTYIFTITSIGDNGTSSEGTWGNVDADFYLIGTFTEPEWSVPSDEYKFTINEAAEYGTEYMLHTTLEEGWGIKVAKVYNGSILYYYPDGYETEYLVTTDYSGDVTIYFREQYQEYQEDWKAFGGHIYIVKDEPAQKEVIRTGLSEDKWGTICPAQTLTEVEGAQFFTLTYLEEQDGLPFKIYFDEIEDNTTLSAGQPYIFIATASEIKAYKSGNIVTEGSMQNGLQGYIGECETTIDGKAEYNRTEDNNFVIYNNCFMRLAYGGPATIQSERCYIVINDEQPSRQNTPQMAARRRVTMGVQNDNAATGLQMLNAADQPMKMLIDGQIYILRANRIYDTTGRMLK